MSSSRDIIERLEMRMDKFTSKVEDIEFELKSRYERINDNVLVVNRNNDDLNSKYHDLKNYMDKNINTDYLFDKVE